jgi:hypothetical protein
MVISAFFYILYAVVFQYHSALMGDVFLFVAGLSLLVSIYFFVQLDLRWWLLPLASAVSFTMAWLPVAWISHGVSVDYLSLDLPRLFLPEEFSLPDFLYPEGMRVLLLGLLFGASVAIAQKYFKKTFVRLAVSVVLTLVFVYALGFLGVLFINP